LFGVVVVYKKWGIILKSKKRISYAPCSRRIRIPCSYSITVRCVLRC
jgi:hypothetical protein